MKRKQTAEAVTFKPVFEVLGIDEENIAAETEEAYDDQEFVEELKVFDEELHSINRRLDGYVRDYEKDPTDRTLIENAYTFKIKMLSEMAKLATPLSAFGKDRLKQIKKCSAEYADFVAPLITRITEENLGAFATVLTRDLTEDIRVGKLHAVGAVRYMDEEVYGAGAAVFQVEYSPFLDTQVGRILWLFVDEDFRGQGVADHLIAELLGSMIEQGIEYITINGYTGRDRLQNSLGAYLMSSWGFTLESTVNPDSILRIRDMKNAATLKDTAKGVKPLTEMPDGIHANAIKNALKKYGCPGYLTGDRLDSGYIDEALSFYVGTETTVTALLLAHRLPSGRVRVEYLRTREDFEEQKLSLVAAFLKQAAVQLDEDTLLYIPADSEEVSLFLEEICPVQLTQYLLEGLLSPMRGLDEEVDAKKVEAWMA